MYLYNSHGKKVVIVKKHNVWVEFLDQNLVEKLDISIYLLMEVLRMKLKVQKKEDNILHKVRVIVILV